MQINRKTTNSTTVRRRGKNMNNRRTKTNTKTKSGGRTIHRANKNKTRTNRKNNRTRRYRPVRLNLTGGACMGPAEMCNFYSHLKYTASDSIDVLDGVPSEANPSPVVQSSLGKH